MASPRARDGDPRTAKAIEAIGARAFSGDLKAQLFALQALLEASRSVAARATGTPTPSSPAAQAPPLLASGATLYTPQGLLSPAAALVLVARPQGSGGSAQASAELSTPAPTAELLRLVEGALARTRVHQLGALPEARAQADAVQPPAWSVEIPLLNGRHLDRLELRIEDHGEQRNQDGTSQRLWQLMMSIEIDAIGPMHAFVQLAGIRLSTTLWAERSATLAIARAALEELGEALATQGVEVARLECRQGRPPPAQSPLFERLLDIRT